MNPLSQQSRRGLRFHSSRPTKVDASSGLFQLLSNPLPKGGLFDVEPARKVAVALLVKILAAIPDLPTNLATAEGPCTQRITSKS